MSCHQISFGNGRTWLGLLACICIGCGSTSVVDETRSPIVMVDYDGHPLADVHVRLHDSSGGSIVAQAITRDDGQAVFSDLPSPEPAKYFVSLESVGDGGWILDTHLIERHHDALELSPFMDLRIQRIVLPPRSVQSLTPNTKR